MLKIAVGLDPENPLREEIKSLLTGLLVENGLVQEKFRAFNPLLTSLLTSENWSPQLATFKFVDSCIARLVRQPVHYQDLAELRLSRNSSQRPCSLLTTCVVEQWPFVARNENSETQKNIVEWIARFTRALSMVASSGKSDMYNVGDEMMEAVEGQSKSFVAKAFEKEAKRAPLLSPLEIHHEAQTNGVAESPATEEKQPHVALGDMLGSISRSAESLEGLDRWDKEDLESAISSGRLGRLLHCMGSEEEEIRRQTFLLLRGLATTVFTVGHSAKTVIEIGSFAY